MKIQIDRRNSNIVYTGFQFGNYYRLDLEHKKRTAIQPKHILGESPYRFNWQTPILLSDHNQDILYFGGNKLHRSLNQGDDWETISEDLTQGGKKGNVAYGTLTTLSESPFQFGFIYTGSDDGLVYKTTNGGGSWTRISDDFPKDLWVSRVVASQHQKERVYVTLNGYRWDDFTPYVYKSNDGGENWEAIDSNLPVSPVNVIREDPKNENILYLGNDTGVYISFDQGKEWHPFANGLTTVAVHDLVIQPEANHLLVGTHGRSIYTTEIGVLQEKSEKALQLFPIDKVKKSRRWGNAYSQWRKPYTPQIKITLFVDKASDYSLKIMSDKGAIVHQQNGTLDRGYNFIDYDLSISAEGQKSYQKKHKNTPLKSSKNDIYYLPKGTYKVQITAEQNKAATNLIIE